MATSSGTPPLSLFHLLDPDVLADPYPLYERLRTEDPVHWDPYLHAWVVTRYADVIQVFQQMSAERTPSPERLAALGLERLGPIARVMVRQMLFLDPPEHTRVRGLAAAAFTPRRVERLRQRIQDLTDELVHSVLGDGEMDVMEAVANPLPSIVNADMLGMPRDDHPQLKEWSQDFAEMLGSFQHNPGHADRMLASVEAMSAYFRHAVRRQSTHPTEGLVHALATAEVDGDHLSEDEVVANSIVTMVGGQETTTNLIGNGMLTLLRNPDQLQRVRDDPALLAPAIEELLRYESPIQHTTRRAQADTVIGGRTIRAGDAVIAVMGAANRDPSRFADPDSVDVGRTDNRHVAFAWAGHFCFGAPLARLEGHIVLATLLRCLPEMSLTSATVAWRPNLVFRGLQTLPIQFKT